MLYDIEPEIADGRRAFLTSQDLFSGGPTGLNIPNPLQCGWYGTSVDPVRGSFCVVREGAGLGDLVGEFLNVQYRTRDVIVYCHSETPDITEQIGLTRRAFAALEVPSIVPISVYAEAIE